MGFARSEFTRKPLRQELILPENNKVQSIRSTPP
jgi:hypothetical protein